MILELFGQTKDLVINRTLDRGRAAHNIAIHVAASSQCAEVDFANSMNHFAQIALQNSVELKSLTSRTFERCVSESITEIQVSDQLFRGHAPARNSRTGHHAEGFGRLASISRFTPTVAVVLLVRTVKFQ